MLLQHYVLNKPLQYNHLNFLTLFVFERSTTVSNGFAKDLRSRISKKINTLPLKYFDQHETGDVLSRITNDTDTIAQNLNQSLGTLVSSITLFIGSIIMMFITNWMFHVDQNILMVMYLFSYLFYFSNPLQIH